MAENDIVAFKELASGGFVERVLTPADISAAAASHASTHHTGGSDPLTAANIGAAPAVNVIELTPDGTTTITTSQLPARGIAFSDGEATFTVNLPTPDIRQSGLSFSIKSEYESGSGPNFITVVHAAVNLLTSYELDEDESSIDFLWDGYAWTYSSTSRLRSYPNRVLQLPSASGTLALTSDFAAPPAIGNTTPNTGAFTTLTANNGTLTASAPVLDLAQTWNDAAVAFTALRVNATNTASAGESYLANFQTGGVSQVVIRKDGRLTATQLQGTSLIFSNGNIQTTGSFYWSNNDLFLVRDAANTLAQRNAANPQTFRIYGTYTSATNHQRMTVQSVKQTLSALSGASATTTGTFIPDGAVVVGVTTRVATALTGASGYEVGDGTDADRWGDITGTAVGTTSDNRDWTAGTIECFTAGGEITLTAKTSNFTAGAIEICVFYLAGEAD